ncbi:MAG: hypothetical protein H6825_09590 [Planctomycetes bacterium]|nr:hypothetical protein [Planctomycetota bacterium]
MTASRDLGGNTGTSPDRRWTLGLVVVLVIYAWAAIGIVSLSLWLEATGRSSGQSAASLLVSHYARLGNLFYSGLAAITTGLLLMHSRHAVWPAAGVAGVAAWSTVELVVAVAGGDGDPIFIGPIALWFVVLTCLAWRVRCWRNRGMLA